MKKLCLLTCAVIFICCKKPEQKYFIESPEIDTAKLLLNHLATQNYEGMKMIYSDTVRIYENSLRPVTLENVIASKRIYEPQLDYEQLSDTIFAEMIINTRNEKWVYIWTHWIGRYRGGENELIIPIHTAWRFVDGKIVEEHSYYNILPLYLEAQGTKAKDSLLAY